MKVNVIRHNESSVVILYKDIVRDGFILAGYPSDNVEINTNLSKHDYVFTDAALLTIQYIMKGFKKNILWVQGIVPEESYMKHKSWLRFVILSIVEKIVLKKVDFVFFVSENMRMHYEKKYRLNLLDKSFVMPCYNELSIYEENFYSDRYTKNNFVYVGGLQEWQCYDETVSLYANIEKCSNSTTKLFVFTKDKDEAKKVINKYHVKNYEIDYVPTEELSAKLKNMKYGFVLREDCAVNNVATPTKFSNYIANGIIPIYSSCLKSFTEYDKINKLGIVYDLNNPKEGLNNILKHMKKEIISEDVYEKCKNVFNTYYNAEKYKEKIASEVSNILNSK